MTSQTDIAREQARNTANGQFGEQHLADPSGGVLTLVAPDPVDVDTVLTGSDPENFSERAVSRLMDDYWNSDGSERWGYAEKMSIVRAKRLADLAAHHYPGCATIVLEPDCDGNDNVTISGLRRADGTHIEADWDDAYDQLVDEARDIMGSNRGWQRLVATEDPGYWYLDVAKAQALTGTDYGLPKLTGEVGMNGIKAVQPGTPDAYTCEACGRSWMEDTPAGRCPFEYDHAGD